MLHLRLSWCTSRWHKQCLTPRKHKYWSTSRLRFQPLPDLLRLQQGAQFSPCRAHRLHLHLWWSTSRRHQQFMLHLRLSWCTSRWHKQCLTPRKHKYWSTSRLRFQPLPDLLRLQQGAQFSPCRAHRLHLHLWWSTSRRHQQFMLHLRLSWCTSRWHKQCLTPRKHKYWSTSRLRLQPLPPVATEQGASLPVVPTVYTCSCGGVRAPAPAVCAAPAPVMVYLALAQALTPRKHKYWSFAPSFSASAAPTATATGRFGSLPVVPTVYTCTCGGVHRAGTSSLCCTCACHGVPRAGTSSVLRRASTSTGVLRACVFSLCRTFCDCNRELQFSPCRAHRLHLHLWCSTSRQHQEFTLHLRLSCTSRWHKQFLTPRQHKYWSTSRQRFQPLPDLLRLQQVASVLSLSCPPSTLALVVEYIAPHAAPAV